MTENGFGPATSVKQPPWCYRGSGPYVVLTAGPPQPPAVILGDDLVDVLIAASDVGREASRVVVVDTHGIVVYARDFATGEFVGTRQVVDTLLGMASTDDVALTLMDTFERCRQWTEAGAP